MKTSLIISLLLIALFVFYKVYQRVNIDNNLGQLIAKGAIILDVRTPKEFNDGHIKDAVNIPLSSLHRPVSLDTGKVYITCCSHGLRSVKAVSLLKEQGFKHVYNGGPWTDLEQYTQPKTGNE